MKLGDAFYLQSTFYSSSYQDVNSHLWFVAYYADDTVVIFNFSSWDESKDQSCKIRPSEYNQLKRISVVMYERGQAFVGAKRIKSLSDNGVGRPAKPIPETVLKKVAHGATISDRIAPAIQKYFMPKATNA